MPIPKGMEVPARTLDRDRAYLLIKQAILDGTIKPGERLDDAELREWLGISSTPVRQALYVLSVEGLVETSPQSYTRVVTPQPEQAVAYLQAIGVLVRGIMDLSLPTASDDDFDRLIARLRVVVDALRDLDLEATIAASEAYHTELVALCRNAPLRRLVEQSGASLAYYVTAVYRALVVDWALALASHEALITAFEQRRIDDIDEIVKRLFALSSAGGRLIE